MTRIDGYRGILTFEVEEPWIPVQSRPEIELMATMPPVEGEFPPNIVVTVNPYGGSLADFSRRATAAIVRDLREGLIVDVDDWSFGVGAASLDAGTDPDADEPTPGGIGRLIEYTHRIEEGIVVSGADYLLVRQGWAIQISTTTGLPTRMIFDEILQSMAGTVAVLRAPEPGDAADVPALAAPVSDDLACTELGGDREALFDWLAAGASIGEGTWMSGDALARTAELQDAVVGRLGGGMDPVISELKELGVLEGGRLSDLGEVISVALTDAQVRVRLTGRFMRGETLFQAFIIGGVAVVAAEQGYGPRVLNQPWNPDDATLFNVQILPVAELTSTMMRWAGAGPAWNLHLEDPTISPEVFEERIAGEAGGSGMSGAVGQSVWQQPWFTWVFEIEAPDEEHGAREFAPLTFVNAGPRGNYRVGLVETDAGSNSSWRAGDVLLWPTDSGFIQRQLEDHVQAAVLERPVVLA
ncbi:hypothetical protein [Zhihengliuella halotolerans]|uniref:hypothetical protein n=1 Tax=Zhihengliuella halotolerans TaxID=370736 RepID=UPI000C80E4CF|nr:hypothetical protein [Zhihengliuella halotolerans]